MSGDEEIRCKKCGNLVTAIFSQSKLCESCWTILAEKAASECSPPIIGGMHIWAISPELLEILNDSEYP